MKILLLVFVFVVATSGSIFAQNDDCSTLQETAFSIAAEKCSHVDAGNICLGYGNAESVIECDADYDFSSPGDIIPLDGICALRVSAMQLPNQWGIAVLNVPVEGSSVGATYVLLGGVEIQNNSSNSSQLRVWVNVDTDVRSTTGVPYEILDSFAAGDVINVNACNCTRHWLRTVLSDGRVGWIPSRNVSVLGDINELPVAKPDAQLYRPMQAFLISSENDVSTCSSEAMNGVLIQAPSDVDKLQVQINGIEIGLSSTVFIKSSADGYLIVDTIDGTGYVTVNAFTAVVPRGSRAVVPMLERRDLDTLIRIVPSSHADVLNLPLALLPNAVDLLVDVQTTPEIVGVEPCSVLSNLGESMCSVHFLNRDGDRITQMEVEFVSASQGEWSGSLNTPEILTGDNVSGVLAWKPTCSLGSENFIGPVTWSITITDEEGNESLPFEASFNCVAG